MNIPPRLRAGDTIQWRDDATTDNLGNPIDSSTWTLSYYLRFNAASEGSTVVGTAYGTGWAFSIPASTSAGFDAGTWYWQALATYGTDKFTLGSGSTTVDASLAYAGSPAAYDGRTQAQKDLEAVQTAIRTLLSGGSVKEYRIGQRSIKRYDLSELIQLEAKLKADVKREQAADLMANGLGNPRNMYVRFN